MLAAEPDHEYPVTKQVADEVELVTARLDNAEHFAREQGPIADAAINTAWAEVVRGTREAHEERKRAQKMREDAKRAVTAAREEVGRAQKAVNEQRRDADAAEEVRKTKEAEEEPDRRTGECIQPVVMPSMEELAAVKRRIQYREDCFHFAVAGISGSGKSSPVNAFRGLRGRDVAVGVTERALQVTRYPDANPENPFVWYEIPGAGAVKLHD